MLEICDLFLPDATRSKNLKFLKLLDKHFIYEKGKKYSGYVGICVNRIRLIPQIHLLREEGIRSYSVPINYKNSVQISKEEAFAIAAKDIDETQGYLVMDDAFLPNNIPLVWLFSFINQNKEIIGGKVIVDRMDGHIWTADEYDKYMYDYNNIFWTHMEWTTIYTICR